MKIVHVDRLKNDVNGNARHLVRGYSGEPMFMSSMSRKELEEVFPYGHGVWDKKRWGFVTKLQKHQIRETIPADVIVVGLD